MELLAVHSPAVHSPAVSRRTGLSILRTDVEDSLTGRKPWGERFSGESSFLCCHVHIRSISTSVSTSASVDTQTRTALIQGRHPITKSTYERIKSERHTYRTAFITPALSLVPPCTLLAATKILMIQKVQKPNQQRLIASDKVAPCLIWL